MTPLSDGFEALAEGRWSDARRELEQALVGGESAEAHFGLAMAAWWSGENQASVESCAQAYALHREADDVEGAAQCAVWLAITYKANFGNFAAANGWIGRAQRLLEPLPSGSLHAWVLVAKAYRMADLAHARSLTEQAVELGRQAGDGDLELVALSQLGLILVGQGDTEAGFALIDEAMAAALAGERSTLDTVVYACCDMLNACELVSDLERATQWCEVADTFVSTYGCPFLYAECRIYYGSVLVAKGRWDDAERELGAGVKITEGASPGLHSRALARLAGLRIRQGRVEEAERLAADLGDGAEAEAEASLLTAAVALARGTRRLRAAPSSSGCATLRTTVGAWRGPWTFWSTPTSPTAGWKTPLAPSSGWPTRPRPQRVPTSTPWPPRPSAASPSPAGTRRRPGVWRRR